MNVYDTAAECSGGRLLESLEELFVLSRADKVTEEKNNVEHVGNCYQVEIFITQIGKTIRELHFN